MEEINMLPDLSDGHCLGRDTEIFFEADEFSHPEMTTVEREARNSENRLRAKLICSGCPVAMACLQWAMDEEIEFGVLGGLTPSARVEMRKPSRASVRVGSGNRRANTSYRGLSVKMNHQEVARRFMDGETLDQLASAFDTSLRKVRDQVNRALAAA